MSDEHRSDVLKGIGFLMLMHLVAFSRLGVLIYVMTLDAPPAYLIPHWIVPILCIGLIQVVYVFPALFYFEHRRKSEIAKGIFMGALITALINGGCFVLILAVAI